MQKTTYHFMTQPRRGTKNLSPNTKIRDRRPPNQAPSPTMQSHYTQRPRSATGFAAGDAEAAADSPAGAEEAVSGEKSGAVTSSERR